MMSVNNLIVISDTHCGDQLGLCPASVRLAHGGTYEASRFQLAVLEVWDRFWSEWVPRVTRGQPFAVLFNGDMIEGRHHGASHQISQDLSDQANIAYDMLAPVVQLCGGRFYYVSGSSPHSGEAGENEEKLAERLGAVPDQSGRRSRYELYIQVGRALVHASHHIGIVGSMAYETTALTKEYNEFCAESARWGRPAPDVVVRSHRHRHSEVRVPTVRGYGTIFVTSSWQLKTPFAFRLPGGRVTTPTIGGSLIRSGDEEAFTRHMTVHTARPETEGIVE
jgi:hypothetical protein